MRIQFILFIGTIWAAAASGAQAPAEASLPHFRQVWEGVYAGGRPDAAGLTYLKSLGIRTIRPSPLSFLLVKYFAGRFGVSSIQSQ